MSGLNFSYLLQDTTSLTLTAEPKILPLESYLYFMTIIVNRPHHGFKKPFVGHKLPCKSFLSHFLVKRGFKLTTFQDLIVKGRCYHYTSIGTYQPLTCWSHNFNYFIESCKFKSASVLRFNLFVAIMALRRGSKIVRFDNFF